MVWFRWYFSASQELLGIVQDEGMLHCPTLQENYSLYIFVGDAVSEY